MNLHGATALVTGGSSGIGFGIAKVLADAGARVAITGRDQDKLARAAATLDIVSSGRFDFGVGASWLREEWDAVGLDFATRGARVDEALQVCRALWTEPAVAHNGRFFDFGAVAFEPKPVQPGGPPLLVGGDGVPALRRGARFGAGWIPMNHTLEQLPGSLRKLAALWTEHDRAGRPQVTTSAPAGSPADVPRAADSGIDRLIAGFRPTGG